ncbi:hypothetical protein ABW19_dt0201134 [Dactylella cylindrospora]|nr:hypothetical protein ABW19_dt0201134 [Dactylella cylindrospora]
MSRFEVDSSAFGELKDKVVVLTGGSTGIGAALVRLLHSHGAIVVFGDVNEASAVPLVNSFFHPNETMTVHFLNTDVTKYDQVLALFKKAYDMYGRIDSAISLAAVTEIGNWFDPQLDMETVQQPPTTKVLDINLLGTLYFSRIACVYLAQGQNSPSGVIPSTDILAQPRLDKNLILVSSVAGFKETPGLYVYQASKHGVLGLMRSLRPVLPASHGIRVNAICPWMTKTQLVSGIEEAWAKEGLPENTPEDVASIIAGVVVDKQRLNGGALFVGGGKAWEFDKGIDATQEIWLGEKQSKDLEKGQEVLGMGADWSKGKK